MAKKKNLSNYGKSVKERLLNISRDEQYSSQLLLSRYFQERLLYRSSVSEYWVFATQIGQFPNPRASSWAACFWASDVRTTPFPP